MCEEIRVGIVGFGFMGRTHLGAFSRCNGCLPTAVVDRNVSCLRSSGSSGGNFDSGAASVVVDLEGLQTFTDADALFDLRDVHLISVTTPTPTHRALGHAVIAAGRHLLVEKPVDLDPAVILELAAAARAAGVLAMPAHCMRFWPGWVWMKSRLDSEAYGWCLRASFVRSGAAPGWNADFYLDDTKSGGAIVDLHIHDTDFVLHCFGTPASVSSSGSRRYVTTRYEYPDGPEVIAEGGWLEASDAPFTMTARFECERGTMTFDIGRDPEVIVELPDGTLEPHPEASEGGTGYDGQARALIEAIRSGAAEPPVTLEDAAETARVLQAEIASVDGGGARQML